MTNTSKAKKPSVVLRVVTSSQREGFLLSVRSLDGKSAQHAITEAGFKAGDLVEVRIATVPGKRKSIKKTARTLTFKEFKYAYENHLKVWVVDEFFNPYDKGKSTNRSGYIEKAPGGYEIHGIPFDDVDLWTDRTPMEFDSDEGICSVHGIEGIDYGSE